MFRQYKGLIFIGAIIILLVIAVFIDRTVLMSNAKVIHLAAAPDLTGQISQTLVTSGGVSELPTPEVDFKLDDTAYFENNTWVVSSVVPLNNAFNPSIVVMKKQSGVFQVVLGPGSAFIQSDLQNVPASVANNLMGRGAVYGPGIN
jgi:hypothetical protein